MGRHPGARGLAPGAPTAPAAGVIARFWRGATAAADGDAYATYLEESGGPASRGVPGNRGFYVLRRVADDRAEFVTLSLWDDLDAIRGFAGDDVGRAVFFPEDDRFLVERDPHVTHLEVVSGP